MFDPPRSLPDWHRELGPAVNTLKAWIEHHDLHAERRGVHYLVSREDLRAFLVKNQQLSAARKALRALEQAEPASQPAPTVASADPQPDAREQLRELRAREATLAEELDRAQQEIKRITHDRNLWRARARAHRASLRVQLELEDDADALADS